MLVTMATVTAHGLRCSQFVGWSHYLKTKPRSLIAFLTLEVAARCFAPYRVDELAVLQSGPVGTAQ
jgi:hypothetical protein